MWVCSQCGEDVEDSFEVCWNCGADTSGGEDPSFENAESREVAEAVSAGVSSVCPKCGDETFQSVRPNSVVAYSEDRICKACGTRYTPPTPSWAAGAFLVIGLVLLVGCVGSIAVRIYSGRVVAIVGAIPEIGLAIVGILAIRQATRIKAQQSSLG